SAKSATLMVRELEADSALDTRLVLEGTGHRDRERLERGLAEAASLAVHLLHDGAAVALVGPDVQVPLGGGRAQRTRILTALALYEPAASPPPTRADGPPSAASRCAAPCATCATSRSWRSSCWSPPRRSPSGSATCSCSSRSSCWSRGC